MLCCLFDLLQPALLAVSASPRAEMRPHSHSLPPGASPTRTQLLQPFTITDCGQLPGDCDPSAPGAPAPPCPTLGRFPLWPEDLRLEAGQNEVATRQAIAQEVCGGAACCWRGSKAAGRRQPGCAPGRRRCCVAAALWRPAKGMRVRGRLHRCRCALAARPATRQAAGRRRCSSTPRPAGDMSGSGGAALRCAARRACSTYWPPPAPRLPAGRPCARAAHWPIAGAC